MFDLEGRRVAVLARGSWAAGTHTATGSGRGTGGDPTPASVYLVRLRAAGEVKTTRIVRSR